MLRKKGLFFLSSFPPLELSSKLLDTQKSSISLRTTGVINRHSGEFNSV